MRLLQLSLYKTFGAVLVDSGAHRLTLDNLDKSFIIRTNTHTVNLEQYEAAVEALSHEKVGSSELSHAMFASWRDMTANAGDMKYLQFMQYLLNYATGATFQIGESEPVRVDTSIISVMKSDEVLTAITELIYSPTAVDSDTLIELLDFLVKSDAEVDSSKVLNREAVVYLMSKGMIPLADGDDVMRVLNYHVTKTTMLIKNEATMAEFRLVAMGNAPMVHDLLTRLSPEVLAKTFNKNKGLYMALRQSKPLNSVINKISKLSKTLHVPTEKDVRDMILSGEVALSDVADIANKMSTKACIKVLNAAIYRLVLEKIFETSSVPITYSIRNGKVFTKLSIINVGHLLQVQRCFYDVVSTRMFKRLRDNNITVDSETIDIAVPTSMKRFLGNIPYGSIIHMDSDEELAVGIHWKNLTDDKGRETSVDLDLSATNGETKVGYGGSSKNEDVSYSGDLTSAPLPLGSNEVLGFEQLSDDYIVNVNLYSSAGTEYKLFVANSYIESGAKKLIADNSVKFSTGITATKEQMVLGVANGDSFTIGAIQRPVMNVAGVENKDSFVSTVIKFKSQCRFSDFTAGVSNGKLLSSLSPAELMKLVED